MAFYNPYQQFQQPVQMQNNGLILVRSEQEARNYPVAYGNSVTFKDETSPFVYTKTMGFSQLDRPVFEKFRLVKQEDEETTVEEEKPVKSQIDSLQDEINSLQGEINSLWKEINFLKERRQRRNDNESNGNGKSV